jgi:signal transduction histidine kinase
MQMAAVLERSNEAQRRAEDRERLLGRVVAALAAASPDDERAALRELAAIVAREWSDLCVVDLFCEESDQLERIEVSNAQDGDLSGEERRALMIAARHALDVARTGEPRLVGGDALLRVMIAPIAAAGRTLGTLTIVHSRASDEPRHEDAELRLLEHVGQSAGLYVDGARARRARADALAERDVMFGAVAHDLRGPLNSIALRTAMVMETLLPPSPSGNPLRVAVQRIQDSAHRMGRLIEDLLDVTRLEAGLLDVDVRGCAPSALVGTAVEEVRLAAAARHIALQMFVEPDLPRVRADQSRILQVFSNLLGNALKFTAPGGTVDVRASFADGKVWFSVTDTGRGIAPEHLPRVFDRFWQLTRQDRTGMGLGLAIAKWIVESHGGEIAVQSSPGRGSTFIFRLPVQSGD